MTNSSPRGSIARDDLLLALIGVPLAIGACLGAVLPVSFQVAMLAGSLPAGGGLGYALFYRPPGAAAP